MDSNTNKSNLSGKLTTGYNVNNLHLMLTFKKVKF